MTTRTLAALVRGICIVGLTPILAVAQAVEASEWRVVDALAPGQPIVVTLVNGKERAGRFGGATPGAIELRPGARTASSRPTVIPKADIRRIRTSDPGEAAARTAALAGAGAMLALVALSLDACKIGCESGGSLLLSATLASALGATVGAGLGHLAARNAGGPRVLYPASASAAPARPDGHRFFPSPPTVSVGSAIRWRSFQSALVEGTGPAVSLTVGWHVSPLISAHIEYERVNGEFRPAPGSVPASVLAHVVPAPNRRAGMPYGIERRRVNYAFANLLGVHPRPWGRLRLEVLAGLGIQAQLDWNYYEASGQSEPGANSQTASYYVLEFQTPEFGIVLGVDGEVAIARGISVGPSLRYYRMGDPGPSTSVGLSAARRF